MKNIIITGCNRGLGKLLAEQLKSHNVIATARNFQSLKNSLKEQKHIRLEELNVSENESIYKFVKNVINTLNEPIDILVNNAAVLETQLNAPNLAKQVFDINYYGVINVTKAILPNIKNNGKIIVISSNLGKLKIQNQYIQNLLNQPLTEQQLDQIVQEFIYNVDNKNDYKEWFSEYKGIYSASKALINAYYRHILYPQCKQQIICIHPGWLKTDMGGINAPQNIEEGIIASMHVINDKVQGSGIYVNEKGKIEEF